ATPDDVSFTHREELQGEPLSLAVVAEDGDVTFRSGRHVLLFGKSHHGLAQIAILRREFVMHRVRSFQHARLELVREFFLASFKQQSYVPHSFLILFRRAQSLDARAEAAFDVILETRSRRFTIDLDIARA